MSIYRQLSYYQDISDKPGIYKITNKVNGKIYIGSSINCRQRVYSHVSFLARNKHHNSYLQNAFSKYGIDSFIFEVIASVLDTKDLCKIEQDFINETECYKRNIGYNLSPTAGNTLGLKQSPETIAKKKGMFTGSKNPFYGKKHSEETRKIISEKAKLRIREKNPFFNKKHNEDTKKKMRNGRRIKPFVCVETGEIFTSTGDAAEKLDLHLQSVSNCVYGRQKTTKGLSFRFV